MAISPTGSQTMGNTTFIGQALRYKILDLMVFMGGFISGCYGSAVAMKMNSTQKQVLVFLAAASISAHLYGVFVKTGFSLSGQNTPREYTLQDKLIFRIATTLSIAGMTIAYLMDTPIAKLYICFMVVSTVASLFGVYKSMANNYRS